MAGERNRGLIILRGVYTFLINLNLEKMTMFSKIGIYIMITLEEFFYKNKSYIVLKY